ncbi:hypothetical protein NQ176_g488 [Zarea fungicola]|uniref:Uncharacterized protein n=1 Tax=Zarea fungicola TaxID=93591 RepID=A0ACC1NXZ7_9HYPO|nr:hypothetical protein NQ176_g488 [Lecanicillium fungicola]
MQSASLPPTTSSQDNSACEEIESQNAPQYATPPEVIIEGDISLRRLQPTDAKALQKAAQESLNELSRWMPWAENGYPLAQAEQFLAFADEKWLSREEYHFALLVNDDTCGSFAILPPVSKKQATLELGFWLATSVTGRGLATRASALLVQAAFVMNAQHVQIRHDERNHRCEAVPRRLGFSCLGAKPVGNNAENKVFSVTWQIDREVWMGK